jgi:ADP-ribosylglycohydrolase
MNPNMDFLSTHPFVRSTAQDKVLGTIIGSALGDCIGLYTEFLPAHACATSYPERKFTLVPITPMRADSHRDKFDPGSWTDDTDHSLLLILSYLHNKGQIIPNDFAARLHVWCREGLRSLDRLPLGIGKTIGTLGRSSFYPTSPYEFALEGWLKSSRKAAANGSLMRTHPLGVMCVPFSLEKTFLTAANMSRTTHVDPRCVVSCCFITALVRGIIRGEVLSEEHIDALMQKTHDWVSAIEDLRNPGQEKHIPLEANTMLLDFEEFRWHVQVTSLEELQLDDSQKMGYVYKCLGSAVLTLRLAMRQRLTANIFENLITDLIMCGGDADTNACVAGALLGCWVGFARLPANWVEGISHRDWLLQKTENLSRLVGIYPNGLTPESVEDPDTAVDGGRPQLTQRDLDERERDMVFRVLNKSKERRDNNQAAISSQVWSKWFKGLAGKDN